MMPVIVGYERFMWIRRSASCELLCQQPVLKLPMLGFTCGRHVEDAIDGEPGQGPTLEIYEEQPHSRNETQKRVSLLNTLIVVVKLNLTALNPEVSQGLLIGNINARMIVVPLK